MAKITLPPVASFSNAAIQTINQNFQDIASAIENSLSRDGTSPNHLTSDLDLNNNDILNAQDIYAHRVLVDGIDIRAMEWHVGTGIPPVSLGEKGDFYLDARTGNVYGPKTSIWGVAHANIRGPQGPQGIQGPRGIQGIQGPQGLQGPQGMQGSPGERGDSFSPDAIGSAAGRSAYDEEPQGFSYLDTDNGFLYFKRSATSGDWSAPIEFGQGPPGSQGLQGPRGPEGPQGIQGPEGPVGSDGVGIPPDGLLGQELFYNGAGPEWRDGAPYIPVEADLPTVITPSSVQIVRTASHNLASKLGAASYKKVDVQPAHNLFEPAAGGGFWDLSEPRVDATMAGAIGDDSYDNGVALEDLCGYARMFGAEAFIPRGRYRSSAASLIVPAGGRASLRGEGPASSVLVATGNQDLLTIRANSEGAVHGLGFDKADRNASGRGLVMEGTAYAVLDHVTAYGFEHGIETAGVLTTLFNKVLTRFNVDGIVMVPAANSKPNAITFQSVSTSLNQRFGVRAVEPASLLWLGGSCEGNGHGKGSPAFSGGVYIANPGGEGRVGANFVGVHFEQNEGRADVHIASTLYPFVVNFDGSLFVRFRTNDSINNIYLETDGTKETILNWKGCAFWDDNNAGYVASADKPFIASETYTRVALNDLGGNHYSNDLAKPNFAPYGPNITPNFSGTSEGTVVVTGTSPALVGRFKNAKPVIRNGIGQYFVPFAKDMRIADYVAQVTPIQAGSICVAPQNLRDVGGFNVDVRDLSGNSLDAGFEFRVDGGL